METAKYAEIRQAVLCNGSKMVVKIGVVYYRGVSPLIYHIAALPATAQEERRDASPLFFSFPTNPEKGLDSLTFRIYHNNITLICFTNKQAPGCTAERLFSS